MNIIHKCQSFKAFSSTSEQISWENMPESADGFFSSY